MEWDMNNVLFNSLDKSIDVNEEALSMLNEETLEERNTSIISMQKVNPNENLKEFQNQVLRQLVTLNARCKENAEYLHVLMLNINDIKEKMDGIINKSSTPADLNSTNKAVSDIFSTFPISNNDELEIITNAIKEKEDSQNKLVNMLALMGGSDYKELTRRILRKIISDRMATTYSFTGHKGKGLKLAFNKTILSTLLCKAVQSKFTTATVKEVENAASIWLTKASDRLKNKLS
eukprot:XP_016656381.1 PREDICTED: uncharacterized protein LOC107882500 [Acyrthosiphon pisum]